MDRENNAEYPNNELAEGDDFSGRVPVRATPGTGRLLTIVAVTFMAALGVAFLAVNRLRNQRDNALQSTSKSEAEALHVVDVVKVVDAPALREVILPGETRAWYQSTIYARVSGYLKKWDVDIGDKVKEGQVLATIETPELDQQLAEAKAKVETEKAQTKLAEANVHFSQVTLARFKDAPKGIVSDLERDEKEADYQSCMARLAAAQSELTSAESEVDRINTMLSFKNVTAPFDGVITQRRVDIGDLVTAGSTASTTPLFVIRQMDQLRVFVDVPESIFPDIRDGDHATAVSDEYLDREFDGRVSRNARAIDDLSKTLRVEVDIPNKETLLLPGAFVKVNFKVTDAGHKLLIPASAIAFRAEGPQIAVVDKDGKVTFRDVTIARELGDSVELTGGRKSWGECRAEHRQCDCFGRNYQGQSR